MEQLVILVIIGLVSLVNWVMQKSQEKREQAKVRRGEAQEARRESRRNIYTQPPPEPAARPHPAAPARDPFRELMEALGLPPGEAPPVIHREATPPPLAGVEEFASLEEAMPTRQTQTQRKQPPGKQRQPDEKEARLASAFTAREGKTRPKPGPDGNPIRSLLSDRSSQRQAVILSEILGRPRAFLPPEEWTAVPIR